MWTRKTKGDVWSPYGHEPARRRLLQQRRAQVIVAALAIAVLYGLFLQLTLDVENSTQQGSTEVRRDEQKPITVTVSPGREPKFVAPSLPPGGQAAPRPVYEQAQSKIMEAAKPFLSLLAPLAVAFWLLSKAGTSARGKLAELNLGVYKGAMPYEMHTARAYKRVFTYREVDAHVFGRTRADFLFGSYLHEPPLEVRRLLGMTDMEAARITALKKGGGPRVTVRGPPPPTGLAAMRAWVDARLGALGGLIDQHRPLSKRRRVTQVPVPKAPARVHVRAQPAKRAGAAVEP